MTYSDATPWWVDNVTTWTELVMDTTHWRLAEQPDEGDTIPDEENDPVPDPEGEPE